MSGVRAGHETTGNLRPSQISRRSRHLPRRRTRNPFPARHEGRGIAVKGKEAAARKLEDAAIDEIRHEAIVVMQDEPLRLGHAVSCAAAHARPGAVAVILPDDLILDETGCLAEMVDSYATCEAEHTVVSMPDGAEEVSA